MSKITDFDRQGHKAFVAALEPLLAKLAEETGLDVRAERGTYDPTTMQFAVKIVAKSGDTERLTFERLGPQLGFKAEDYGKPFTTQQGTFLLRGVSPSGCVLATDSHGKPVKWPTRATDSIVKKFHPDHKSWDEKFRDAAKGE